MARYTANRRPTWLLGPVLAIVLATGLAGCGVYDAHAACLKHEARAFSELERVAALPLAAVDYSVTRESACDKIGDASPILVFRVDEWTRLEEARRSLEGFGWSVSGSYFVSRDGDYVGELHTVDGQSGRWAIELRFSKPDDSAQ